MGEAPKKFVRVEFSCYTDDDIRRLSAIQVTNSRTFDEFGHATTGGLYDRRFGPYERTDTCSTCFLTENKCPGHLGHIDLTMPVYNPVWMRQLEMILRGTCFHCKKLLEDSVVSQHILCMIRLIDANLWHKLDELQTIYSQISENSAVKVIRKMVEFVGSCIRNRETEEDSIKASRFLNQSRQELLTEYMASVFSLRKGHCNHCSMPIRKLRQEHHVRMFFDEGASRRGIEKAKKAFISKKKAALKKKKKKLKKNNQAETDEPGDIEAEPDIESGEDDEGFDDMNEDDVDLDEQTNLDVPELEDKMKEMEKRAFLTPSMLRDHMRQVWDKNTEALKTVCRMLQVPLEDESNYSGVERPTDIFFLSVVPVPPTRFRPVARRSGSSYENPVNTVYSRMIEACDEIKKSISSLRSSNLDPDAQIDGEVLKKGAYESLHKSMTELQLAVNNVLDRDLSKIDAKKRPPGLRQLIEKKQGLFRKNMMGKRVDFAARSVITPDPNIGVDEVGIPMVFATKLTFPESVNVHNLERLRKAVINGPNLHPGATHVISESGAMTILSATNQSQREALAHTLITDETDHQISRKPKIVCRHVRNGDMLLMNRQPTLHRPSIQAHKVHVLPGEKTMRLHYANCNAYNADFDGDEMNAHLPQSFIGQSEAREIVTVHNQYLVPKNGAPLAGLIQDHVIGGVTLTMRGRFFSRKEYQQLVYYGLVDQQTRVQLLPPAILKPQPMWSGKQVVSTVLRNILPCDEEDLYINLTASSKISAKSWVNSESANDSVSKMGEETVIVRQGHLLQGVLDKNQFGATRNGLVHCCYELYGGSVSSRLLTSLGRLFTYFLKSRGFSLGVEDILCIQAADKKRLKIMSDGAVKGSPAAAVSLCPEVEDASAEQVRAAYTAAHFDSDSTKLSELDLSMKSVTDSIQNDISRVIMPNGLLKRFPENNLQLLVVSGAKGSSVNCMQISCLLGQIELEGKRPPLMISGKSLPSFARYDTSPRAGGFIDGRFLSGIRPQEYFFHCMAGREGLVDTAVKTSRSGYLQRCLIKHLEGIMVAYDSTVRDCDGSIIQFQYGEDGLSVLKTNLLSRAEFPTLIANHKSIATQEELTKMYKVLDRKKAKRWDKKVKEYKNTWSQFTKSDRRGVFLKYSDGKENSKQSAISPIDIKLNRTSESKELQDEYRGLSAEDLEPYVMYGEKSPEPTLFKYPPTKYFHSLPEKLGSEVEDYKEANPDQLLVRKGEAPYGKISVEDFEELISLYSCRSRAEPGDCVGILAAQSIGEPSTQMTLNTFHFAGRGEMNVTLGIPRLREVLMVASKNQKTPSMDIPFHQTKYAIKRAKNLQLKLSTVKLSDVLEKADITSHLVTKGPSSEWGKVFAVRLQFLPPAQYIGKCLLTPKIILQYVESTYVRDVCRAYLRAVRANSDLKLLNAMAAEAVQRVRNVAEDAEEGEGPRNDDAEERDVAVNDDGNDDDDESDGEVDDGEDKDAAADKELAKHNEEHDYDGEEDEIAELLGDEKNGSDEESDGESVMSEDKSDAENYVIDKLDSRSGKRRLKKERKMQESEMNKERVANVMKNPGVHSYTYDVQEELWCEVTFKFPLSSSDVDITPIAQSVAYASLVCDPEKVVKGISKAILVQPKTTADPLRLKTVGVNIQRMFQYESILDLNNLYTNDIHAMAETYGIEAACRVLIKEIRDVFAAYGITVNYRHLSLIADYMTFDGQYKAFNRDGLTPSASTLQKMTFEASTRFLKSALLAGAADDVESPSARIVVGRPVKVGTGLFECVTQLAAK